MENKTFTFEVNQILYEFLFNLVAQGFLTEEYVKVLMNNEAERIWFHLNNLIPYKNDLIETGGEIRERILIDLDS